MLLQNRMDELNSAIINIIGEKIYVTGFTREEILQSYLNTGKECWSSKGIYDKHDLNFHNIKSNALIIVMKDGIEINRYQYKPIYRDTIQYKSIEGKTVSVTFTIRKSSYSMHYHLLTEKLSLLFNSKEELDGYLLKKFNVESFY